MVELCYVQYIISTNWQLHDSLLLRISYYWSSVSAFWRRKSQRVLVITFVSHRHQQQQTAVTWRPATISTRVTAVRPTAYSDVCRHSTHFNAVSSVFAQAYSPTCSASAISWRTPRPSLSTKPSSATESYVYRTFRLANNCCRCCSFYAKLCSR